MKKLTYIGILLASLFADSKSFAQKGKLIPIKIGALSANDPLNTEYNRKYRTAFEGSLFYALGRNTEKIESCGYSYDLSFGYYTIDDKLSAKEQAEKLEKSASWLIIGPDRSDHFILASKGISNTILVSSLAGSKAVTELKFPYFTMSPSNLELAKVLHSATQKRKYGIEYGIVVDRSCKGCMDLSESYQSIAGQAQFNLDASESEPNIDAIKQALLKTQAKYLLLPNYSRLSGRIISSLSKDFPMLKFAGGDGWGDDKFSFLVRFPIGDHQQGLTVRMGASDDVLSRIFKTNSLRFSMSEEPSNYVPIPSMLQADLINRMTDLICKLKPQTKEDFTKLFKDGNNNIFKPRLGIGLYELNKGALKFVQPGTL